MKKKSKKRRTKKIIRKAVKRVRRKSSIRKTKKRAVRRHSVSTSTKGKVMKGATKKRRQVRKAKRYSPHEMVIKHPSQIVMKGKSGRRKKRHSRAILMGNPGEVVRAAGANMLNILAGTAGGIGGAYVANMTGISDPKVKSGAAAILGLAIASTVRIPAIKFAGIGLGIVGAAGLVKAFLPSIVLLGDSPIFFPARSSRLLGDPVHVRMHGAPIDFQRNQPGKMMGWQTQASMG